MSEENTETRKSENRVSKESFFKDKSVKKPSYRSNAMNMTNLSFLLWSLFLSSLAFSFLWLMSSSGKVIYTFETTLDKIGDTTEVVTDAWTLDKNKKLIEVELSTGKFPQESNNSAFVIANIYQADTQVLVNTVAGDFYHAHGYDDGYWTENENSKSNFYKVDSAGVFVAVLSAEEKTQGINYSNVPVKINIREGDGVRIWWYAFFAIAFISIWFVIWIFTTKD